MEAQLHRTSHGHEDGGTHSVVEGGGKGEQHQEKKSVLKKVKDKAKKIKDTVKKHGHAHHHHEEDGEPIHESTVVRSRNLPKESNSNPNNYRANIPHPTPRPREERGDPQLNLVSEPQLNQKISSAMNSDSSNKGQGMKEYLFEKLKPGDEDKALSEAITDALAADKEPKRGKVTVSKEVAERLGTTQENKREGEDALASGEESSGQGVAERLQNAVSSWMGKSNGIFQTAQDSVAHAFVSDAARGDGPGPGPMPKDHR